MKNLILFVLTVMTAHSQAQVKNNLKLKPKTLELSMPNNTIKADVDKITLTQVLKVHPKVLDRAAVINIKSNESWEIRPNKLRDKDMYVESFFGEYNAEQIVIYPILLKERDGTYYDFRYLKLRFRPEIGQEYRVKVSLKPKFYGTNTTIMAKTGRYNTRWTVDDQRNEILIVYRAENSEFWLSNLMDHSSREVFLPTEINKIEIDKI